MSARLKDASAEWTVTRSLVGEVDGYAKSVGGVEIEAVRTAAGDRPNEVVTALHDRHALSSCSVGFPMRSRTTTPDDIAIAALITAAPNGSRWCDIELREGSVLVYGPKAEHTAVNLPGLEFTFVTAPISLLEEKADQLGCRLNSPRAGHVVELEKTDRTRLLGPAMTSVLGAVEQAGEHLQHPTVDLERALTLVMSEEASLHRIGGGRAIDCRHIVHVCIDYADATQRIPSITELCLAAHVSERRLRDAFVREFGLPPSRYFRSWALGVAHRRLRDADPTERSVTEIAADLGFDHLGRFAGHYRGLYRETPSTTLRNHYPHAS